MTPFTPPAATTALPAPVAQSNQIYGGPERSHGPQLRKTPTNILKKKREKNHKKKSQNKIKVFVGKHECDGPSAEVTESKALRRLKEAQGYQMYVLIT